MNKTGTVDPALVHTGARHFWRSDFTAWHRPQGYISVKTSSTRTFQPESGNGRGQQQLHLADGVTLIMRDGREYDGILGVWNWRKLPGTTTEQGAYSLHPHQSPLRTGENPPDQKNVWGHAKNWGTRGTTDFAGGAADGTYAASAFHYDRGNVSVKKAWFFFDEGMLALGTDLSAPNATASVETTLNQCLLKGPVTCGGKDGARVLETGQADLPGAGWVHHDGTGYFFGHHLGKTVIRAAPQAAASAPKDKPPAEKDVFILTLPHGTGFTGKKYAYIVIPGLSANEMPAYRVPMSVLRNDSSIQAAHHAEKRIVQAVFHKPGKLSWKGYSLTADTSCIVLFQYAQNELTFHAASPEAKATPVQLKATAPKKSPWYGSAGITSCAVTLQLPAEQKAGATVGVRVTPDGRIEDISKK